MNIKVRVKRTPTTSGLGIAGKFVDEIQHWIKNELTGESSYVALIEGKQFHLGLADIEFVPGQIDPQDALGANHSPYKMPKFEQYWEYIPMENKIEYTRSYPMTGNDPFNGKYGHLFRETNTIMEAHGYDQKGRLWFFEEDSEGNKILAYTERGQEDNAEGVVVWAEDALERLRFREERWEYRGEDLDRSYYARRGSQQAFVHLVRLFCEKYEVEKTFNTNMFFSNLPNEGRIIYNGLLIMFGAAEVDEQIRAYISDLTKE